MGRDVLATLRGEEKVVAARLWAESRNLGALVRTGDRGRAGAAITGEIARTIATVAAPSRPAELDSATYRRRTFRHGVLAARSRLSLARLVAAYQCCTGMAQAILWGDAGVGEEQRLRATTEVASRWLETISRNAAHGYAVELRRLGREGESPSALAEMLILGYRSDALARCAALPLVTRYRPLVGIGDVAPRPWRQPFFARALQDILPVLHCESGDDLVLLCPDANSDGVTGPSVAELIAGLPAGEVHWATVEEAVTVGELPAALRRARTTAQLGRAAGLPVGRVTLPDDVAVEALGLRDPVIRPWLDEIGHRLATKPALVHTLAALYRLDLDRSRTAAELGITRRALYGRLDRIEQLTGLGPTTSTGIQLLGLALTSLGLGPTGGGPDPEAAR